MLAGEARCGSTRADPQLLIDGVEVGVYRARTQVELLGDLGVGEASGYQPEHLDFPSGESGRILRGRCLLLLPMGLLRRCSGPACRRGEVVGQSPRDGRAEDRLSTGRRPYRPERLASQQREKPSREWVP